MRIEGGYAIKARRKCSCHWGVSGLSRSVKSMRIAGDAAGAKAAKWPKKGLRTKRYTCLGRLNGLGEDGWVDGYQTRGHDKTWKRVVNTFRVGMPGDCRSHVIECQKALRGSVDRNRIIDFWIEVERRLSDLLSVNSIAVIARDDCHTVLDRRSPEVTHPSPSLLLQLTKVRRRLACPSGRKRVCCHDRKLEGY
ncbi:hypothetical protein FA15DRAFT_428973 [Coprinopsis marcescibilis]|uniref:Uncharacterized protein n=1 Tax=Coprinopsis marcescibilis TaxID=230819 RepID=A0A5C3L8S9_COPMA|nr:hypothetical protein FA15DRAFT_428973 [Coprinopsis marcescibilis]